MQDVCSGQLDGKMYILNWPETNCLRRPRRTRGGLPRSGDNNVSRYGCWNRIILLEGNSQVSISFSLIKRKSSGKGLREAYLAIPGFLPPVVIHNCERRWGISRLQKKEIFFLLLTRWKFKKSRSFRRRVWGPLLSRRGRAPAAHSTPTFGVVISRLQLPIMLTMFDVSSRRWLAIIFIFSRSE